MFFLKPKIYYIIILTFGYLCNAQTFKLSLTVDTNTYDSEYHTLTVGSTKKIYFFSRILNPVASLKLTPLDKNINLSDFEVLKVHESSDFEIIDSFYALKNTLIGKVRFKDLIQSDFLTLTLTYKLPKSEPKIQVFDVQPIIETYISVKPESEEAFIGEEKIFELNSVFIRNIIPEQRWYSTDTYEYMISEKEGKYFLHIVPTKTGRYAIEPKIKTLKPKLENQKLVYETHVKTFYLNFKEARLPFLSINLKDITLDETSRTKGVEVMIDYHPSLYIRKTYRIEKQEEPGGHLIAEIYTRNKLSNGKVTALLRTYNLHNTKDGTLYLKDGDQLRFLTNFNITPPTQIHDIYIKRPGGDWEKSNVVYPGETIELKLTGESLNKAPIFIKDVLFNQKDTALKDESNLYFLVSIPLNIATRNIEIYNGTQFTNKILRVKEFLEPRNFDFIVLDYGKGDLTVSSIAKPILYDHVIKDVVIKFKPDMIDKGKLHGEQMLNIRFKITTLNNQLVDQNEINGLIICPDESSPRGLYYDKRKCNMPEIHLNNYLRTKTYDMRDWSRLEIEFEHAKEQYQAKPVKQKIEIILQKHTEFDIDVSFPAGLLIQKANSSNFGNFSGISMATIAQLSFFHPERIAKYRPYKFGLGFLAINAFNFNNSPNISRDVGAVALLSVYPLGSRGKLTFPLYMGAGYFLAEKQWFYLLGPGIRVSF
jgi:hypothetical protein